jgi:hypothetical protein
MVELLRTHVASTGTLVSRGTDPNLPMSTPTLRALLRNGTKVSRRSEATPKGVVVTETSDDAETVALLQAHAADVTKVVNGGMAALHEAMAVPAPTGAPAAPAGPAQGRPTRAGQEAFATIAEIVRILDADPATDWSRVNLEALRQHLMDMDDVTMRAGVRSTAVPGGAAFDVEGTGRVREAIRRMAIAHGATITPADGFTWQAEETPGGARVTVRATRADDSRAVARIRGLGFVGLLTLGDHHTAHHLGIANGSMHDHHRP